MIASKKTELDKQIHYLAAVLEHEVSARNASEGELRIKAAGFPARKTLDDSTGMHSRLCASRSPLWPRAGF